MKIKELFCNHKYQKASEMRVGGAINEDGTLTTIMLICYKCGKCKAIEVFGEYVAKNRVK